MAPRLEIAERADLLALRAWFPDRAAALAWGGPGLRYPFDEARFLADLGQPVLPGYLLRGPGGSVLAVGPDKVGKVRLQVVDVHRRPERRGAHGARCQQRP